MKQLSRFLVAVGLIGATSLFASPTELQALTCQGTYGPAGHNWTVKFTVISGAPLIPGRGFAEVLSTPNFPSGVRIAPEGYYLTVAEFDGMTEYKDAFNHFDLRIPFSQPPGDRVTGPIGTLTLSGNTRVDIACD
jgi:hypothetical protein